MCSHFQGKGISGVEMTVISEPDKKMTTKTLQNGEYTLENVTTGQYMFKVNYQYICNTVYEDHIKLWGSTVLKGTMVKQI